MATDAPPEPVAANPKRRGLQFGLRTLFVLVTVAAVELGLRVNSAERQRRAVAAVRDLRGSVVYDDAFFDGRVPERVTPERAWYRKLLGDDYFSSVVAVNLASRQASDSGLEYVKGLARLERLNLAYTQITDAGLAHLKGLTQLQVLSLSGTQVSDAGLGRLKRLSRLEFLSLDRTQVTSAGLVRLKGLTRLKSLELQRTQVTDAGLEHLKGLTQLKSLNVNGTQVTTAGVTELQKTLPNCQIYGP